MGRFQAILNTRKSYSIRYKTPAMRSNMVFSSSGIAKKDRFQKQVNAAREYMNIAPPPPPNYKASTSLFSRSQNNIHIN